MEQTILERQIASVLLIDAQGRILMQHRDEAAPVSPLKWSLPGGGIELGETPEEAAHRELEEETGLKVDGALTLFWQGLLPAASQPGAHRQWYVYTAPTQARQEDVVLGEGQAMVFTPLERVLDLDLSPSIRIILERYLQTQKN